MRKSTLTLTAAALSAACLAPAQAGLVAYYSFDTDFSDASGNGNDLSTLAGSPAITNAAGEVMFGGGALSLDGSSTLSFASPIAFSSTDAWSVSFWGKRATNADFRSGMIVGSEGGGSEFIWTPDNSSQVQGLRFRNTSGADVDFDGFPDDAAYHHWVVVADGAGSVTVYRDNSNLGTQLINTTMTINAVGTGAGAANIYDGSIDELYIFDEAIDAATVDSLFTSNVVPTPSTFALASLGFVAMLGRRRRQG